MTDYLDLDAWILGDIHCLGSTHTRISKEAQPQRKDIIVTWRELIRKPLYKMIGSNQEPKRKIKYDHLTVNYDKVSPIGLNP